MEEPGRRFSSASLPLVATVSRPLPKEQTLQVEYLRKEIAVLRSKVPGPVRSEDSYGDVGTHHA